MKAESPSHGRWLAAGLIWILAGLFYPALSPATAAAAAVLQRVLNSALGWSDELAFRVAFTVLRVPLMVLFGMLVGVFQCAEAPALRRLLRRWLSASAVGAAVSTLIFLPSSLILRQVTGLTFEETRVPLTLLGAALLSGLISFLQRRAARRQLPLPALFVVVSVTGMTLGVLARLVSS
jgi:hypothetical protein